MQDQDKKIDTLQALVDSMTAAVTETLKSVQPLVQRNNELIEENNELRKQAASLQKTVEEEKKFNDDKYNFYIQHITHLAEVEMWMREQAQPWMEEVAECLGKRIPDIEDDDRVAFKYQMIKDDVEDKLIRDGYEEKAVKRILKSIIPKGLLP